MNGSIRRFFLLYAVSILSGAPGAFAQSGSSTILGTLTDPSDAVVAGATIVVTDLDTGTIHNATSNQTGLFRVLDLVPGHYSLVVKGSGFKALEINDIELPSSETRDLGKLVLQLGAVSETVDVTADATPVQTASSERSALIDSNQLSDVALKGRDPFGYMRLVPGIVDTSTDRSLAGPGGESGLYINGMDSNTKNATLDGVTEMDQGGSNAVYVSPNMDAIGEIKVLSSAYQAEYGRTAGGGINVVTKSGTREFHGTAFWQRRHEDMDANLFFNNRQGIVRPIYRYFVGGYSFGGPVYIPHKFNTDKHRLFFFASQEFTQVAQPTTTVTSNLPTAAERTGNFSGAVNSLGAMIAAIDPNTGKQFPGNIIPPSRIDPTGQAILNLFQLPNGYVNPAPGQQYTSNYIASATPYRNRRDDIFRGDWAATSKLNVYLRYGHDTSNTLDEFTVSPGVGSLVQFLPGYNYAAHAIYVINPTMVNELIVGRGHNNFGFYYAQGMAAESANFRTASLDPPTLRPFPTGPTVYEPYLPAATFAGGALPNTGAYIPGYTGNLASNNTFPIPYKNFNDTYTFQDDLSKTIGTHSLKTGLYYEYNSKIEPSGGYNYAGAFNFGSSVNNPLDTGIGYANALLGIFQTYTEGSNRLVPDPHFAEAEGYVQDNWRVSHRFTLDYGVRWYHMGLMYDTSGTYSEFYPQLWNPSNAPVLYRPATVAGKSVALDPLNGTTTFFALQSTIVPGSGSAVDGMHISGLTGKSDYAQFPYLVFSPRLGFAWNVFGDDKTVVRGSFGTFYNRPNANYVSGKGSPPVIFTPIVYYSQINQIPQAAASAALSPTAPSDLYGPQKMERNHQINLTIQHNIGFATVVDVAYVGNFDRHAQATQELNQIPEFAYANPANVFNNTEINPNLLRTNYPGMGSITYYSDDLSSVNYNGLQTQIQHRLSHGIQFGASYVFSKSLGSCATVLSSGGGCTIDDPFHTTRGWYYGPLPWDRSQVVNINYAWKLPGLHSQDTGFGNRLARGVLNDWTLSGIISMQTGAPVTPDCSSLNAGPANSDPSLSGVGVWSASNPVGARCQEIASPNDFQKSFYTNFNTSAFTLAAPQTFGNIGLGILHQPSWYNIDATLDKRIPIGKSEKRVLRARIEAYNVFNHAEFSTIGTSWQMSGTSQVNTTYGQDTATLPARVLSTTLRFEF